MKKSKFSEAQIVFILRRADEQVGYPKLIRADQGSEFISRYLDLWAYRAS